MSTREPTSHERMAGQPWDASYREGPPPWDIGGPQPAVLELAAAGGFRGVVLDIGCGAGDNALHIAAQAHSVLGVDAAATAIAQAQAKAVERGVDNVRFQVGDALALQELGGRFDTVLDSALFHAFDADEHVRYAASLAAVTQPGAVLHVICFSDVGADLGPHPVSRAELEAAFMAERGWRISRLEPARLQTRFHGADGAPAWRTTVERR